MNFLPVAMASEKRFDEDRPGVPRSYRDARRGPFAEPVRGSLRMSAKQADEAPGAPGSAKPTKIRRRRTPARKLEETMEERFFNRLKYVIPGLLIVAVLTASGILAYRAFTGGENGGAELSEQWEEDLSPGKFGQAYLKANGGAAFLRSLRSIRATGTMESPPEATRELLIVKRAPDKTLFHLTGDGVSVTYGTNGKEYWRSVIRDNRIAEVILLEGRERASLERSSSFFVDLLAHFLDSTGSIEGIEADEWEDRRVIRVDWVDAEKDEKASFFVDPGSMNLLRSVRFPPGGGTAETLYGDYRSLDAFRQPFRIENRENGELVSVIVIDSAEVNPGIPALFFDRPTTTASGRNPGAWSMEDDVRLRLPGAKTGSP